MTSSSRSNPVSPDEKTVLVVVRHPVGGIRTFLRYFCQSASVRSLRLAVLAGNSVEIDALQKDLNRPNVQVIHLGPGSDTFSLLKATAAALRSRNVKLLHAHGLGSGIVTAWLARLMGTPVLLTLHDVFVPGQFVGLRGFARRVTISIALLIPSTVHCVSHDAAANLLEYFPILRVRKRSFVAVVLNGILSSQFRGRERRDFAAELNLPGTFTVGFLGRFMNQKGFADLVSAVELLRAGAPLPRNFVVLCFSAEDGFIREERARVERAGLSSIIRFLPFVPDAGPTLRGLDAVVMPSRWEACPLLAMEALTVGTPLLASDCVGLREVVRDTPARVFATRSPSSLAAALRDEMQSPSTARAAEYAPTAAARFDVAARTEELLALMHRSAGVSLDG